MRHESLYLTDIVEAADHIADFISAADFRAFQESELLRSAVVQKLAIIGEAAARVSEDLRTRHPQVPWPQIIAFRNILIHAYFGIDWDVVWRAAKNRCPVLREQIAEILVSEPGASGSTAVSEDRPAPPYSPSTTFQVLSGLNRVICRARVPVADPKSFS